MSRLLQVIWIALLALLGGLIALTGVSYSGLARGQAPMALQLFVAEGEANSKLADGLVRAQEYAEAERYARQALKRSLADVRSVRSIALAAEQRGSKDEFLSLLDAAGKLTWRDSPAQAKLFEQKLIAQDYLAAIDHADALMRRRDATAELIEVFIIASTDETLIEPIADKLAAQPTWRASFFANAELPNRTYFSSFSKLMGELGERGAGAAVTREELAAVVYKLNRSERLGLGMQLWNGSFPQDAVIVPANQETVLAWSNAQDNQKPLPFDWAVPSNRRSYVRVTSMGASADQQTLEVDPNPRASGTLITKTMKLPAGAFKVTAAAPDSSEKTLERVFWTVRCDGKGDRTPLPRVPGEKSQWRGTIGECGSVLLELNLREGERRDLETLLVDQVTITAGL